MPALTTEGLYSEKYKRYYKGLKKKKKKAGGVQLHDREVPKRFPFFHALRKPNTD